MVECTPINIWFVCPWPPFTQSLNYQNLPTKTSVARQSHTHTHTHRRLLDSPLGTCTCIWYWLHIYMHVQLHHIIVSSSMGDLYFKIMHTKHIAAHAVSFPDPTNIVLSRRERVWNISSAFWGVQDVACHATVMTMHAWQHIDCSHCSYNWL